VRFQLTTSDGSAVVVQLLQLDDPNDALEFYEQFAKTELEPEIQLWFAVLTEAFDNYKELLDAITVSRKKKFNEVFDWMFNEHDELYMGAFENVCLMLNLEPNAVRREIVNYTKKHFQDKKLPEIGMEFCKSLDPVLLNPDSMYVSKTAVTLGFDIRYLKGENGEPLHIELPYYIPVADII
jgi:hypothetical protein